MSTVGALLSVIAGVAFVLGLVYIGMCLYDRVMKKRALKFPATMSSEYYGDRICVTVKFDSGERKRFEYNILNRSYAFEVAYEWIRKMRKEMTLVEKNGERTGMEWKV